MSASKPNVVFLLTDQLRAMSLPMYGENQIKTPNIDRLRAGGVNLTNAVSPNPLCTPYRSALLTGRWPQTTGHTINFVTTRHDEIGIGDVFKHAGYKTGWVGKWHLHCGSWPGATLGESEGPFYVPYGRDRLGFDYWRAYNFHKEHFNGWINLDDWQNTRWPGYETDGLLTYVNEFIDMQDDDPFCLFISPHQPHDGVAGQEILAPEKYYDMVPGNPVLPANVPDGLREKAECEYRSYLAMILAVDDMLGAVLDKLEENGTLDETLFVFASDHGCNFSAHGRRIWEKQVPYEESIHTPLIMRLPGKIKAGSESDVLIGPQDMMATLCSLCGIKAPSGIEGYDLADAVQNKLDAFEQDAMLTMNFTRHLCFAPKPDQDVPENPFRLWRGVRTKDHCYARWVDGSVILHDIIADPLEEDNLAGKPEHKELQDAMEATLQKLLAERGDKLEDDTQFHDWFDEQRRIIKNAFGPLPHPDTEPDWSRLNG